MRAAVIDTTGDADLIRLTTLPVPDPGPSEVLVRVLASPVNPVDTLVRSGRFRTPMTFPFVIGRDLVGSVARAAPQHGYAAGEPVWCNSMGHGGRPGAAAEYVAVPADRLYRVPAHVDPRQFVAQAHPFATAHLALLRHAGLRPGETLYLAGAGGHVGRAATGIAHRLGARIIATAGAGDLAGCRVLGADVALDYRDPELTELLREHAGRHGFDVHVDTSGTNDLATAVPLLATGGRIVVLAGRADHSASLPVVPLYTNDCSVIGFVISRATVGELAGAARHLRSLAARGMLPDERLEELPLEEAAQAHRRLADGTSRGIRLLLTP